MPYASRLAQGTTQVGRRDFVLAMSGTVVASCIQSRECGGILALPLSRSARNFPLQERPASAGFSFRSTRFAGALVLRLPARRNLSEIGCCGCFFLWSPAEYSFCSFPAKSRSGKQSTPALRRATNFVEFYRAHYRHTVRALKPSRRLIAAKIP